MGLPGIISNISALAQLWIWLIYVPQYVSLAYIASVANGIAGLINQASIYDITPLIAESFLNGKKHLTQYYVGQVWRFTGQVQGFFFGILIIVFFALPSAFGAMHMTNYLVAIPFFIPSLISNIPGPYFNLADQMQNGANRPYFLVKLAYFEQTGRFLILYIEIVTSSIISKIRIKCYRLDYAPRDDPSYHH